MAVALLPEVRAGRISTSSAGAAFFEAELLYPPGGLPPCTLPGPPAGARFCCPVLAEDPARSTRRFSREVYALSPLALAEALDGLLRSVTVHAALADAVLEARAVRLMEPAVYAVGLVEVFARDLWAAGFPVSFGPSWAPEAADVAVGVRGLEEQLELFLRDHAKWRAAWT